MLKRTILSVFTAIALALAISPATLAQAPAAQGTLQSTPGYIFDQAYALSKPLVLQQLSAGQPWGKAGAVPSQDQRWAICAQAQAQGYLFDEEIDGLGWDPFATMSQRQLYGDAWVYPGQGNVGISTPASATNTGPMPANAIKVSTTLADYPVFPIPAVSAPPIAPPVPQVNNPIGGRLVAQNPSAANNVGDIFQATPGDGYAPGAFWPISGTAKAGAFVGQWQKQALELGMWIAWVKVQ